MAEEFRVGSPALMASGLAHLSPEETGSAIVCYPVQMHTHGGEWGLCSQVVPMPMCGVSFLLRDRASFDATVSNEGQTQLSQGW